MKHKYYQMIGFLLAEMNEERIHLSQLLFISIEAKQSTPELAAWEPTDEDNKAAMEAIMPLVDVDMTVDRIALIELCGRM